MLCQPTFMQYENGRNAAVNSHRRYLLRWHITSFQRQASGNASVPRLTTTANAKQATSEILPLTSGNLQQNKVLMPTVNTSQRTLEHFTPCCSVFINTLIIHTIVTHHLFALLFQGKNSSVAQILLTTDSSSPTSQSKWMDSLLLFPISYAQRFCFPLKLQHTLVYTTRP